MPDIVHVTYTQTGQSSKINGMGMRETRDQRNTTLIQDQIFKNSSRGTNQKCLAGAYLLNSWSSHCDGLQMLQHESTEVGTIAS